MISTPFSALVQALPSFVAGISSLSRIEDYVSSLAPAAALLAKSELIPVSTVLGSEPNMEQSGKIPEASQSLGVAVSIQNGRFGWGSDEPVLDKVNLIIPHGSVTAVMGPVGAGKSILLHGILKQSPVAEGQISVVSRFR
jgi:ABC-type multidrug transport system fused ATPase/permease subunit